MTHPIRRLLSRLLSAAQKRVHVVALRRILGYSGKKKQWLVEKLTADYGAHRSGLGTAALTYLRWHEREKFGHKLGFPLGENEQQPEGDDIPAVSAFA